MTDTAHDSRGALRGSSGATLQVEQTLRQVYKTGNDRVGQQGRYIQSFGRNETFPAVYTVDTFSYSMELLRDPSPLYLFDPVNLTSEVISKLQTTIWCRPAEVSLDSDEHMDKLYGLTSGLPDIRETLARVFNTIEWKQLRTGRTHGDPTFDNIMHRGDEIVLIDPLPPTSAIPDLISKDVGKVLMSLYGFENARYGSQPLTMHRVHDSIRTLAYDFGEQEFIAARYWAAVHLLRAVPYMPNMEVRNRVTALARHALSDL